MSDDQTEELTRTVTFTVSTRPSPGDDPFYEKETLRDADAASLDYWNGLDTDHQRALATLTVDTFTHLATNPAAWLPRSLVAEPNSRVQIVVTIEVGEIQEEVCLMRSMAERGHAKMRDELLSLHGELQGDADE